MDSSVKGVGIAGAMDYKPVQDDQFICYECSKVHANPYGAKASPMKYWCSVECMKETENVS
jgi:hypothetical protein